MVNINRQRDTSTILPSGVQWTDTNTPCHQASLCALGRIFDMLHAALYTGLLFQPNRCFCLQVCLESDMLLFGAILRMALWKILRRHCTWRQPPLPPTEQPCPNSVDKIIISEVLAAYPLCRVRLPLDSKPDYPGFSQLLVFRVYMKAYIGIGGIGPALRHRAVNHHAGRASLIMASLYELQLEQN